MNTSMMTQEQIRLAGVEVLTRELGVVGMIRFFQQFEIGQGNYTLDRHRWLDAADVDTLVERIRSQRGSETSEIE